MYEKKMLLSPFYSPNQKRWQNILFVISILRMKTWHHVYWGELSKKKKKRFKSCLPSRNVNCHIWTLNRRNFCDRFNLILAIFTKTGLPYQIQLIEKSNASSFFDFIKSPANGILSRLRKYLGSGLIPTNSSEMANRSLHPNYHKIQLK